MPFDWHDFRTLAQDLSASNDEAKIRTAISRAYYAAYHKAKQLYKVYTGRDGSHESVWRGLLDSDCLAFGTGFTIGGVGDDLKQQRISADYNNQKSRAQLNVSLALRRADAIISDVERLLVAART